MRRATFPELKLNQKLQHFAFEVVKADYNLAAAAKNCGIDYETAKKYANREDIRATIATITGDATSAARINKEFVLSRLYALANTNVGDLINDSGEIDVASIAGAAGTAVSEYQTSDVEEDGRVRTRRRVKLHDKLRALELLGRHLAMFTDKVQVDGLDNLAEEMKLARKRTEQGH